MVAREASNFSLKEANNYLILAILSEETFPSSATSTNIPNNGAYSPAFPTLVACKNMLLKCLVTWTNEV